MSVGAPSATGGDGAVAARPTHAERARTLSAKHRAGMLSTLASDPAGYPFGSLVIYALDGAGRPIFLLSSLAEHTANFVADPRASLLVCEAMTQHNDPLALARVTLVGRIEKVPDGDVATAKRRLLSVHPIAQTFLVLKDFSFYRLTVEGVRYVGGYGRLSWVEAGEYAAAEPDPLTPAELHILTHMNEDLRPSLLVYARTYGGMLDATEATMTAIDRYGFEMTVETPAGRRPSRIDFASPIASDEEARRELVRLARDGRAKIVTDREPGG